MTKTIKCYSELIKIKNFHDRFEYLKLDGLVGEATFGGHRYLNQLLYRCPEWRFIRRDVIIRDDGNDLAHEDFPILGNVFVHHINPITVDDILNRRKCVFDLENLISASQNTHNAIHYGDSSIITGEPIIRRKNDTCPWR